ncbi:MAG: phosphoribosylformylglycinamidine synthase subunit PurQ [Acidimicrobiia bacterium]|nr:phosphoribosylformylglycinamidine synthase subunit PurQ [Acidimicrobiia bacterium]
MSVSERQPSVLIPIAPGTNRNDEMALAFEAAGAVTVQMPLEAIRGGETTLDRHQILALPGGFSYGDALGAGRLLGLDLRGWFEDQLQAAREAGLLVIGVCNGFQALVHAGLLPGVAEVDAALVANDHGRFECRWVWLQPVSKTSVWTAELAEPLWCPIAHGEGRFVTSDSDRIVEADQVAFRYADRDGQQAHGTFPANPNGSTDDIAGICDPSGLVLGMMPHPEDHVFARQQLHRRRPNGNRCLPLFAAGVRAVADG